MHRALIDSRLKASQFVVFPGGGGGVGIQGVQLAKAMGMRPIVIDSGDAKRKLSLEMGAEEFVDFMYVLFLSSIPFALFFASSKRRDRRAWLMG
jgi:propanol-preferring alcohol dehydrogenase